MRGERRNRALAFLGTIALHVAVVWWLASSPEAARRILSAVEMDFVEVPPPEVESPPAPPLAEAEDVAPEPEPAPEPVRTRRPVRRDRPVEPDNSRPPTEGPDGPPSETPGEGEPDQAPGPRVIDFGEQNFVTSGAGWSMAASNGGSRIGVYRPGVRGGGGGPSAGGGVPSVEPSDFNPVPTGRLSRRARLRGPLHRRYPPEARRRQIEGSVRLMVEIRSSGAVRSVRILSDPGGGLGEAAVEALRRARFRAALDREGRPVDTRIVYTVRFILDD